MSKENNNYVTWDQLLVFVWVSISAIIIVGLFYMVSSLSNSDSRSLNRLRVRKLCNTLVEKQIITYSSIQCEVFYNENL